MATSPIAEHSSRSRDQCLAHLTEGVQAMAQTPPLVPDSRQIVQELRQLEQQARSQGFAPTPTHLTGRWRLTHVGSDRQRLLKGRLWRWPAAWLTLALNPEGLGTIRNQVQVGHLTLAFQGPCRLLRGKRLLAFDFRQVQLLWGDRPLLTRPLRGGGISPEAFAALSIQKLPFFAWIAAEPTWIAARGRGGGLALWRRNDAV